MSLDGIWDVLSTPPTFNPDTIHTDLVDVSKTYTYVPQVHSVTLIELKFTSNLRLLVISGSLLTGRFWVQVANGVYRTYKRNGPLYNWKSDDEISEPTADAPDMGPTLGADYAAAAHPLVHQERADPVLTHSRR